MRRSLFFALLMLCAADRAQAATCNANVTGLQACINAAALGDTITVAAGTSIAVVANNHFTLPDKGAGTSFITITTAEGCPTTGRINPSHAASLGTISSSGSAGAGRIFNTLGPAHHYRFQCLKFDWTGVDSNGSEGPNNLFFMGQNATESGMATTTAELPHHIEFDRILIDLPDTKGAVQGIAIFNGGEGMVLQKSYLSGIKFVGGEAKCLGGTTGTGPVTVDNNYFACGSMAVMVGGGTPSVPNTTLTGFTFTNNYVTKKTTWWTKCVTGAESGCGGSVYVGRAFNIKNHFELKNAQDVTISHNIFENNWAQQGQPTGYSWSISPTNDTGDCTYCKVHNVTFQNNIVRNVGAGISISGNGGYIRMALNGSAVPDYSSCVWDGPGKDVITASTNGNTISSSTTTGAGPANFGSRNVGDSVTIFKAGVIDPAVTRTITAVADAAYTGDYLIRPSATVNGAALATASDVSLDFALAPRDLAGNGCTGSGGGVNVNVLNNLFYGVDPSIWGVVNGAMLALANLTTFTANHNTWVGDVSAGSNSGIQVTFDLDGSPTPIGDAQNLGLPGFTFKNSMMKVSWTGYLIDGYSRAITAWNAMNAEVNPDGVWAAVVFGTSDGLAPFGETFPTGTTFKTFAAYDADFENPATADYRLKSTSTSKAAGDDGTDIGVNMCNGAFPDPAGDGSTSFSCGVSSSRPRIRFR